VFDGGYHGSVLGFAGGGSPINAPYEFVVGGYNDVEGTAALLAEHGESVAAVLVEPMMGTGGCLPASGAFMSMLREETARHGSLLVFDEVMTSRLAPGGAQELLGVTPDLTTFGKYLGGGMSFGAFGGRRDLMDRFDPSRPDHWRHAGTFNNNVLTMAAGITGLEQVFTVAVCEELNARGDRLRMAMNEAFERADVSMQATGLGSLLTIHATHGSLTTPADLTGSDERVKELLFFDLLADGFWVARRGMVTLSLPLTDEDCARFLAATEGFLERRAEVLPSR
jgi:glutamate-1-semialdehyde 2,1-aminomutase